MRRSLVLLLGLAGCVPVVEVPHVSSYGEAPAISPTEDESELLAALDAALGRAELPTTARDEALLAATRARCAQLASSRGKPATALQVAQALHAAGVGDERYVYLDRAVGYATHSLDDAALDQLVAGLKGEPGAILSAACRVDDGAQNQRYFAVTLVARRVSFQPFLREVAPGIEVPIRGSVTPPVAGAELLLLSPTGKVTSVPVDPRGAFSTTIVAEEGRTVLEVVAPQAGLLRRLASAAIQGGEREVVMPHGRQRLPTEPFPPGPGAVETGSGGQVAAALEEALGQLQSKLGQQPASTGEREHAFALLETAARASNAATDTGVAALAARRKAAGIDGQFEVVAGRVPASDLKLLVATLAQSPSLARALSRRGARVGVGAARVPRADEFEYAIVVANDR